MSFICSQLYKDKQRAQISALRLLLLIMYLMLALKAETVGSDIRGYGEWYKYTGEIPFGDFSYCYMEKGYVLLMKLGNIMGLSFQAFEAVLYAITIIPIYFFLKNHSSNVMISILVLFCLDYYVFTSSGLRQTVAMSFCVGAFTILSRTTSSIHFKPFMNLKAIVLPLLIVVAASFIHRSALLFIPVILISFFQYRGITYTVFLVVFLIMLFVPRYFLNFNEEYSLSRYEFDEDLTLGRMFMFDVLMLVFYFVCIIFNKGHFRNKSLSWQYGIIVLYGLLTMAAFNGSILMRSAAYELLFMAIIIPDAIQSFNDTGKKIISAIFIAAMFYSLFYLILEPNSLRIVPYRFFFQ